MVRRTHVYRGLERQALVPGGTRRRNPLPGRLSIVVDFVKESFMETKDAIEIEEVVFESLEGCNEAFEKMTMAACCSTEGGPMCGCGPQM